MGSGGAGIRSGSRNPANHAEVSDDFYAAAEKNGNMPLALADMQREALARIRKQQGLLAAVRLAGSFILSQQGPRVSAPPNVAERAR
jgi:hypothetical protein